jgi:hypothetical protein
MAYGFGTQYGTGANTADGIATNFTSPLPTRFSMGGWVKNSGIADTGVNFPRVFVQDDGLVTYFTWWWQQDIGQYIVQVNYSTSPGFRHWTYTANVWQHNIVTWDLSDTTNGPHIYQNGIDQGRPGDFTAGTGTVVTSNTLRWTIGCRNNNAHTALNTGFDGLIDDIAIWNEILSPGEVMGLYTGALRPYQVRPGNLLGYWPLDGYQQHAGLNLVQTANSNVLFSSLLVRNGLLLAAPPPQVSAAPLPTRAGPIFRPSIFQPAIYLSGPRSTGAVDLPTMLNVGADFRRRVATIGY